MARVKPEAQEVPLPKKAGGHYFGRPNTSIQFIPSGCTLLDLVLGGGWARRRVANVVGNRSSGKCVKNAFIITDKGFERIDDIGENFDSGTTVWSNSISLENCKQVSASHFWKESVSTTVKIRTRHGYSIEGTEDHKILTWTKDCQFEMLSMSQLSLGDVAVISKTPWYPFCEYKMPEAPPRVAMDSVSKSISTPHTMTEEMAELLGFYVADGNTAGRNISFSNTKKWFAPRFFRDLEVVFGVKQKEVRFVDKDGSGTFTISRTRLFDYFNLLFDGQIKSLTARYKYVPRCVLESSKKIQAAFLRGLIDCDSWSTGKEVVYSTASEKLAQQIHLMLLNFGVVARRAAKPGPGIYADHMYWDVAISGKFAKLYHKEVGYSRHPLSIVGGNKSEFDSIPFLLKKFLSDLEDFRKNVGWSRNGKSKVGRLPYTQFNVKELSFRSIHEIVTKYAKYSDYFDLSIYKTVLNSEYHFDFIESIETLKNQDVEVFDIHVPDQHRFWANGFINHNTLLAIEAAANFHIIEPKGNIRYRESESAFDIPYAEALGFPADAVDFGEPMETVEDLFEDLTSVVEKSRGPELYIVDSLDALSDRSEMERDIDQGSYGAEKAKKMSQLFRRLASVLATKDVTLLIVSQIRDNVGGAMFAKKYVRSGGRALDFYASQILMLQEIGKIPKTILGVKRSIGIDVLAKMEKSKVGLPYREAEFPIIFGYGINDRKASKEWLKSVARKGDAPFVEDTISDADLKYMVESRWWTIENEFLPDSVKYPQQRVS